jgi:glycine cleavage system H protein
MAALPADCRYSKTHEWVRVDGDIATIGITDHAQDSLGDITFVELPASGTQLQQGGECGVIESVKAASDLYSPLKGTVSEVNSGLEQTPETINSDPHGEGWLFKITGIDQSQLDGLMDAEAYGTFLESQQ